jgi:hypothetical protein
MDARFFGIDNILSTLGINSSKQFDLFYTSALEGRETLDLNIEGFVWDEAQLDFTYEALEAEGKLKGMATYVDLNSEPLARGKAVELSKLTGSIPRQKRKILRGENDYRKQLIALQTAEAMARLKGDSPYQSVRDYLTANLFDTLAEIPDSHNASLSFQVGQMKSARKLSLTTDNNPSGIAGVEFSAQVPDENVVDEAWYTITDGAISYVEDADPILTLKKKIREIKLDIYKGYQNVTVEINAVTFFKLVEHPKVLQRLGYSLRPDLQIVPKNDSNAQTVGYENYLSNGDEFIKEFFKRAIGADQLILNTTIVGVDKLNATSKKFETKKLDVFEQDVVLIRPTGTIGTIKNVAPLRPDGSAISAGIFGGRGIIEYRYNAETREQTWVSELTILAVPNQPKKMYYYNIKGEAAEASATSTEESK